jgi:co-chaperonin GroES (HSP10)
MIQRPEAEDKIGGKVQLDHYQGQSLELDDWKLDKVLDDILMCQYADINDDGTEVKRGSIWVPINVVNHAWRIGKVTLVGPDAKQVKVGQHIIFPGDKGLVGLNRKGKTVVFLNEQRIFGICKAQK